HLFLLLTPTPHPFPLSLHDPLPISHGVRRRVRADSSTPILRRGPRAEADPLRRRSETRRARLRPCGCPWGPIPPPAQRVSFGPRDRKSTRLNSSHQITSYAVFSL